MSDEERPRRKRKKKKRARLPKRLLMMPNADKGWHEKNHPGRDLLNFPHPWRCMALGKPNSGKTLVIKNILIRADPPFERVIVIHCNPGYTREYDDVGAEMLDDIPGPKEWGDGEQKTLVICDDLEFKQMSSTQKRNVDRLVGFVSTHMNISVCFTGQDPFNLPPIARRCASLMIVWKSQDISMMRALASRTGISVNDFMDIINNHLPNRHDALWIDLSANSPANLRINGYDVLELDK